MKPIRREMGLGHNELFRILPRAVENRKWTFVGDRIFIEDMAGSIEIRVSPESVRQLGVLQLPVTLLEFYFAGLTDAAVGQFMRRFDLSFRRGGG